ncbi:MAG: hypothetical protein ACRDDJ_14730, partial [[Mycobacterium] stephanolepidis]
DEGLLLPANYQRQRRQLAQARKAAFAAAPTGPDQVRQLDFTEFETTRWGDLGDCRLPLAGTIGPNTNTAASFTDCQSA